MSKQAEKPPDISQKAWDDADIPEWTDEDFARAIPFKEAHPEAYAAWKRGRGRPQAEMPKVHVGFRMAADVVKGIKATGKGYNARVESVLREALAAGKLDARRDLADGGSTQDRPKE
jgi:uncharacterized protein (DUF4415 family)